MRVGPAAETLLPITQPHEGELALTSARVGSAFCVLETICVISITGGLDVALWACLHGGGGPQVGVVTRLDMQSYNPGVLG